MKEGYPMTAKDGARLTKWLKAHGHSAEEADECIEYIIGTSEPVKPADPKK